MKNICATTLQTMWIFTPMCYSIKVKNETKQHEAFHYSQHGCKSFCSPSYCLSRITLPFCLAETPLFKPKKFYKYYKV